MQGYVYLDYEGELHIRTQAYIQTENPLFWANNASHIDFVWDFDTDNDESMTRLFSSFSRKDVPSRKVMLFCQAAGGYDIAALQARNAVRAQAS